MDFTPLINRTLQFRKLILGLGLLILTVLALRSLSTVLALAIILGLLVVFVPSSVPYLQAVWRSLLNLFAFLLLDFS